MLIIAPSYIRPLPLSGPEKEKQNEGNELDGSASNFHNHHTNDIVNIKCYMNIGISLSDLSITSYDC